MAISLNKGGKLSLSKEAPDLKKVLIGLGWDARATDGADFDLDASAFLLDASGKVRSEADFIFYNQLKSACGSVQHTGDNHRCRRGRRRGGHGGLTKVPADVQKITFTVTIHEADQRRQNFGQVGNAFIRLVNAETNSEVARYDLAEDASTETAMIFGEIYRHGSEWKFGAVGQGYAGGLAAMCNVNTASRSDRSLRDRSSILSNNLIRMTTHGYISAKRRQRFAEQAGCRPEARPLRPGLGFAQDRRQRFRLGRFRFRAGRRRQGAE
jgi:tellurium resistance protein TerD